MHPDTYEKHCNDCRAAGDYVATQLQIDGAGLIRSWLVFPKSQNDLDAGQFVSVGLSGGGPVATRIVRSGQIRPEIRPITVHRGWQTIWRPDKPFLRLLESQTMFFCAVDQIWRVLQRELDRPEAPQNPAYRAVRRNPLH